VEARGPHHSATKAAAPNTWAHSPTHSIDPPTTERHQSPAIPSDDRKNGSPGPIHQLTMRINLINREESISNRTAAPSRDCFYEDLTTIVSMFDAFKLLCKQPLAGGLDREYDSDFIELIQLHCVPALATTLKLEQYLRIIRNAGPAAGVSQESIGRLESALKWVITERRARRESAA
jgi:hypothetical protein